MYIYIYIYIYTTKYQTTDHKQSLQSFTFYEISYKYIQRFKVLTY